ncbi:unnamed protein product [Cylicocyclus nassatus]|uniref:Uncharacterized protein n=1 Tax=Cylicocyclus nassatus TaxID=53992 RepID=A0AA36MD47_CYLNA|nr:unnamed protein product [Cylicocyclus nassatus]
MRAWMLALVVLMITAMSVTMAGPLSMDAPESESEESSNVRQKRQFLYGYPSYRSFSYGYGYGYPSYGRLYYPSFSIWG